ncbi:MAG TPA: hypothetical protein VM123_02110 [archaeon]|nr:hypothetical protein [archaeon]
MNLYIIGAAVVIFAVLAVLIYIRIGKQRRLISQANKYEALLKDSRVTRWQYSQSLEKSRDILKDVEQISGKVKTLKAELFHIRADIHEQLRTLRHEIKKSGGTELDRRVIIQMKVTFGEKWKFFNSRKLVHNETLDKLRETEKKRQELLKDETAACQKWTQEKEKLMKLWRELNDKIKVTNPYTFYS